MKKIKKFYFRTIQKIVQPGSKAWYWAEKKIYPLRTVVILPTWIHRTAFIFGVWLVRHHFPKTGDCLIHRIPLHVRYLIS